MADADVVNVMLGEPGEDTWNTLVLGGTDVVVPVERDAYADPFQDDEVRLRSVDGSWDRRVCSSDDDVEEDEDASLLLYHFRDVPYGVYSVFVVSAGREVETLRGLVVRRQGVFIGEKKLVETRDGQPMASPAIADGDQTPVGSIDPHGAALSEEEADYIDQDDEDAQDGD